MLYEQSSKCAVIQRKITRIVCRSQKSGQRWKKRKRNGTKPYRLHPLQVGQMIFLSSHEGPREKLYPICELEHTMRL